MKKFEIIILSIFVFSILYSQHTIKLYNWHSNISIKGKTYFDNFSKTIVSGDLNNDGYQDLVIASPNADPRGRNSAGTINIFLGNDAHNQQTNIDLSTQTPDIAIYGSSPNEKIGLTLYCDDLNNDGYDDLIIAAPLSSVNNLNNAGKIYIFLGQSQFNSEYDLSEPTSYYSKINGEQSNQNFGKSIIVSNFTGTKHIFISAPFSSYNSIEGCGLIYAFNFFQLQNGITPLNSAIKIAGTDINENIGLTLAQGNFNEDNFADILIGCPNSDFSNINNGGKIFVIKGRSEFSQPLYYLTDDFITATIIGGHENSKIGRQLYLGDINNDNKDDIIFSNDLDNSINIFYGSINLPSLINLQESDPDIKIVNNNNNLYIGNFFPIFDFNNDNINDLFIQIYSNVSDEPYNEYLTAIYGRNNFPTTINLDNFEADIQIFAETYNEDFGSDITICDINNDGLNDITISAPNWQNEKGKSYSIFGGLPYVTDKNPDENQTNVLPDTNITFKIQDNEEGINIDSVSVIVAGNIYTKESPNFIYSGTPNNYLIVINPQEDFGYNQVIDVIITAKDLGNWNLPTEVYAFTTINDIFPPFTANWNPAPNETGISVDTEIYFNIYDNGTGVDINSVTANINNTTYTISNGNLNYSGSPDNYLIHINPLNNFNYGETVNITINASDLANPPNVMNPFSYHFICNKDTIAPRIKTYYPENEQTVGLNSKIKVTLVDNETGINQNNINLLLDNTNIIQNCSITTVDSLTYIEYSPTQQNYYSYGTHIVEIQFQDNAYPPNGNNFSWNFYCIDDMEPPMVVEVFPQAYSNDNPTNTNFYVKITDLLTGVNINYTDIIINSENIINSPNTEISAIENGYKITYNNPDRFLGITNVTIASQDNDIPPNQMNNYSYYFICTQDTVAPYITNLTPNNNQLNVPIDTNISFDLVDDKTGLDNNSIHIFLNYEEITTSSQINFDNSHSAHILYNPPSNFSFEDTVYITIQCNDLAINSNYLNYTYSFVCEKDSKPPYITNENPPNNSFGTPIDTDIDFDILDDGLGVDSLSINISLIINNSIPITISPEINKIEKGYHIHYNPTENFSYKDTVNLVISANDLSHPPNTLNSFIYSFICEDDDTSPPFLFAENPGEYSIDNPVNTSVSFEILDKTSGIDKNSIIFKINDKLINNYNIHEVAHHDSIGYYLQYIPPQEFLYNQTIYIYVFAIDLSTNHNILEKSYFFKTEKDTIPPELLTSFPSPNGFGYCNSSIFLKFFDSQSGINPHSFILDIDNLPISTYQDTLFENYYTITYKHQNPFIENTSKIIHIYLEDNIGNFIDSTYTISIIKDEYLPYINFINPNLNSTITLNDTLVFELLDKGTGINQESIKFSINNKDIYNYNIISNPHTLNPDSLGYKIYYKIDPSVYYKGQILKFFAQCSDFANNEFEYSKSITIFDNSSKNFKIIPKTITPNSDGWNDNCRILINSHNNLSGKTVYIYSVNGFLVNKIKLEKINENEFQALWNGKYKNGKVVTSGIYIAQIKLKNKYYQGAIVVAR